MTETSFYWGGTSVGDASLSPYSSDEWSDILRKILMRDRTTQGPVLGYENELAVSNPSGSTIRVETGAALVDGKYYENDAQIDTVPTNPTVNPRIDIVTLTKDFTAQTVRVDFVEGAEAASPVAPSLTQNDGVEWQIPLGQYEISTGGVISNLTDSREFSETALVESSGVVSTGGLIETITGDGTSSTIDFQNIDQSFDHLLIIGQVRMDGAINIANLDVRFNNDGTAIYNHQNVQGENTTESAAAVASDNEGVLGSMLAGNATASFASQLVAWIPYYTETNWYKNMIARVTRIGDSTPDTTFWGTELAGVLWRDTSAISRITLQSSTASSGNFATGTRVSLYGI